MPFKSTADLSDTNYAIGLQMFDYSTLLLTTHFLSSSVLIVSEIHFLVSFVIDLCWDHLWLFINVWLQYKFSKSSAQIYKLAFCSLLINIELIMLVKYLKKTNCLVFPAEIY